MNLLGWKGHLSSQVFCSRGIISCFDSLHFAWFCITFCFSWRDFYSALVFCRLQVVRQTWKREYLLQWEAKKKLHTFLPQLTNYTRLWVAFVTLVSSSSDPSSNNFSSATWGSSTSSTWKWLKCQTWKKEYMLQWEGKNFFTFLTQLTN